MINVSIMSYKSTVIFFRCWMFSIGFFASESPDTLFEIIDVDEEIEISTESSAEEVNMKYKHDNGALYPW